jgi:hypothetical protein
VFLIVYWYANGDFDGQLRQTRATILFVKRALRH